ncbi:MAG: hypothetical protein EOP06_32295, partial [Proteobacteria bacterium]
MNQVTQKQFTDAVHSRCAVVIGVGLNLVSQSAGMALSADIIAIVISFACVVFIWKPDLKLSKASVSNASWCDFSQIFGFVIPVGITQGLIGILSQGDILIAKSNLGSYESGLYAAVSSLGRIPIFASGALSAILLPRVLHESHRNSSSARSISVALILTFLCSASFCLLISVFAGPVIKLMLGPQFIQARFVLILNSVTMTVLALIGVVLNFFLGKRIYTMLPATAVLIVSGYFVVSSKFHESATDVAVGWLYVMASVLVYN